MKLRSVFSLAVVLAMGVATLAAAQPKPKPAAKKPNEKGFVKLFNGKDLTGWHGFEGTATAWSVKDGVIHCDGRGSGSWLVTDKEYEDFAWRIEYRISRGGNSGLCIRAAKEGNPAFSGMEIQIIDDYGQPPNAHSTGSIYASVAPSKNMSKPAGEWNEMEVTCKGRIVSIVWNGEKVLECNLDSRPELKTRVPSGFIGMQNHGSEVEFRNIRIKAPKPAATTAKQ